jgi:cytochrome c biogenesis protein CcdA
MPEAHEAPYHKEVPTTAGSPALGRAAPAIGAGVLLVAVVAGGVLSLLYFWSELLQPGGLNAVSLPLVAFLAGVAATFNPCGLPALPGFLAFGSGAGAGLKRRPGLSLAVAFGSLSVVVALGIVVGVAGSGTKGVISPYFRWVQLAVGVFLILMA